MTYPVNNFYSATYPSISANGAAPTSVFDTSIIPIGGYAMILGVIGANKSTTTRGLNLSLRKSGSSTPAYLLFDVALPPQTSFQVISGDKLVVQRGDVLAAWADSAGVNNIDLVISYVVYTPAS
jgi:hypothetical protein